MFPINNWRTDNFSDNQLSNFIHNNMLKRHGISSAEAKLYWAMDRELMAMAYTFILIKFSGNCQSIVDLTLDCITPSPKGKRYLRVEWKKHRKKLHINEFEDVLLREPNIPLTEESLTVVDVINLVIRGTRHDRTHVIERDKNALFVGLDSNKSAPKNKYCFTASKPALGTFRGHFKKLCLDISHGKWTSTPKAIRTSQLLLCALLEKDVFAVQEKARHTTLKSSSIYVNHIAEKLRREQNIREFFDWMETLVTINIEGFAEKIGIDVKEYEKRKKTILNQQFGGVHCQDPYAGHQPGTKKGEACSKVDKCVGCGNRRRFFLISVENICNLLHWHDVLNLVKNKQEASLFESKWGLWFIFTSRTLERLHLSAQHKPIYSAALKNKSESLNPYLRLFVEDD
jgi:hypothetical protein